ncbi:MAG TPA: endonuclease/exonuclease/phosphatase family protein [Gemmatimonadales bacterium]|nr:endonuclease/exonuclease/phosphatase family protein [Gemmatimonadales bacterium]
MSDLVIRLVSLNLWDLPVPLPRFDRRQRGLRLLQQLPRLDADLLLFQESFRPGFRRLLGSACAGLESHPDCARKRRFLLVPFDATGGLLTLSRWPITAQRHQPAHWSRGLKLDERIGGKGCLWTRVRTPAGELVVGNAHLYAGNRGADARVRARQARELLARGDLEPGLPTVVAGDFNWDPGHERPDHGPTGDDVMREAGFREVAGGRTAGLLTKDPRTNRYARFLPWHPPPRRLTHVFYRGPRLGPGPVPPALCLHDPPVSDHYGLRVTLRFGAG